MPGMRCAISSCSNSYVESKKRNIPMSFHSFPRDKQLRNSWILSCKRTDSWNPATSYICSGHFREEDFEVDLRGKLMKIPIKRQLKRTAVPTICLTRDFHSTEVESLSETLRQSRVKRRENKEVEALLKSAFILKQENIVSEEVATMAEYSFEEKYRQLLKENEVLKQKCKKLEKNDRFHKNEIERLKKQISSPQSSIKIEKT